jgi:hypothetical protein
MDLGKILKGALPWIASALPGPFGVAAKALVTNVLGLDKETATDEQIAEAMAHATPEQIIALKNAENEFKARMTEMGYKQITDLERIAADDRASARSREIAVRDNTPMILAYLYAFGFFATLGAEIWISISKVSIEPIAAKSIDILLGVLVGMVLGTKEYYFGSSSGSRAKDTVISDMANKQTS